MLVGVADGLATAHEAGILHRDIKPENVLVSRAGYAKLADFGLAKLDARQRPENTQALTAGPTRAGMIVGTAAYMSPEQTAGRTLDARSDVFSFGILIYELLTSRRPFEGENLPDVLHAIGHATPKPLAGTAPIALQMIVEKALEKDPADRYQTMRELVVDLRRLARRGSEELAAQANAGRPDVVPAATRRRVSWAFVRRRYPFSPARVAGLSARLIGSRSPARSVQLQRLTDLVGLEEAPALSPDGRTVAFVAVAGGRRQIYVRLLAGGAPLVLTKDDVDHYSPRWSSDSSRVIYYTPGAQPGEAGTIWEIPALGGTSRRLVNALGPGDPSHDGTRLAFFRFRQGAFELAVATLDRLEGSTVATLPTGISSNLRWSPDDKKLAYLLEGGGFTFASQVMVADVSGGSPRRVAGDAVFQGVTWLADGSGLIVSSSAGSLMPYPPTYNLWKIPLDGSAQTQLTFGESSYEFPGPRNGGTPGRQPREGGGERLEVSDRRRPRRERAPGQSNHAADRRRSDGVGESGRVAAGVPLRQRRSCQRLECSCRGWRDASGDARVRPSRRRRGPGVVAAGRLDQLPVESQFEQQRRDALADEIGRQRRARSSASPARGPAGPLMAAGCTSRTRGMAGTGSEKYPLDGGSPVLVRTDNAIGCNQSGDALYYAKILTQATGAWDFELRVARPENGPSSVIARVSGSRVPCNRDQLPCVSVARRHLAGDAPHRWFDHQSLGGVDRPGR